jgi:hypothetical protein
MSDAPAAEDGPARAPQRLRVQPDVDLAGNSPTVGNRLSVGLRLDEYEVSGVIGEGGFGIVYLAWDHSLQRRLAIKEYMPASLACRTSGLPVEVRSEQHLESFNAGLRSFVNEAKLLARFDHPSLLKVYRFWQANGTAYMVMPYYEGPTLKQALAAKTERPDEQWLRELLGPVLDALEYLHAASCYHRDIAPDNILLIDGGRPLLLDFGAARRLIGDMSKSATVILKTGYAPIEQYGDMPGMSQGPWTDIYALGAVLHHAITGEVPRASVSRLVHDDEVPLAQAAAGRYSAQFLRGIDRMLAVQPAQRPQSIAEVRGLLGLDAPLRAPPPVAPPPPPPPPSAPVYAPAAHHQPTPLHPSGALPSAVERGDAAAAHRKASLRWVAAGAALLLALGVFWLWQGQRAPVSAPVAPQVVAPVPRTEAKLPPPPTMPQPEAAKAASAVAPIAPVTEASPIAQPPAATPAPRTTASAVQRNAPPAPRPHPPTSEAAPAAAAAAPAPRMNARCVEIIQRISMGEALTVADRAVLKEECKK